MENQRIIDYLPPSEKDIHLFLKGNHFTSYKFLGAHKIIYKNQQGINFTLWAPNAKSVRVIGDFNHWTGEKFQMQQIESTGIWTIFISDIDEGDLYKYEILTHNGQVKRKADPYGFWSELRPNTASKVYRYANKYHWKDEIWRKNKKKPYDTPMNIYELHLGSWRHSVEDGFLTYREAAKEVIPYILDMGYTHIELLPIMEHPYDGSWGYQITGYYSVTSRYGQPDDLKYFIDQCHQNGIGVILDWVPGHFCKDEHGLYEFDGSSLYEHRDLNKAQNYQWGTANFDFSKPEVCSFLISNAIFWFKEFHIDGLRVDAVSYMLYLDESNDQRREHLDAIEFLKKLNTIVFQHFPNALMIAEDSTAWPLVTTPVHDGGLGFNYKWNMGWMNDMLQYMKMDPNYRKCHHKLITFSFTYAFSENFILPLSHDEVVHGKKSLLDKMPGDYLQKFANLRLLYSYMYAHPGKKLLFMGGEFGQFIEWDEKRELDWFLLDYDMHRNIKNFIKDLNILYKNEEALFQLDHHVEGFMWINHEDRENDVYSFIRKTKEGKFILAVFNFAPNPQYQYKIGIPKKGLYQEIFNSDNKTYGGSNIKNKNAIKSIRGNWHNQPNYIELTIPPLSAIYIKRYQEYNQFGGNSDEKSQKTNGSHVISRRARF